MSLDCNLAYVDNISKQKSVTSNNANTSPHSSTQYEADLLNALQNESQKFDPVDLLSYLEKLPDGKRLLYTEISKSMYGCSDEIRGNITTNIDKALKHAESIQNPTEKQTNAIKTCYRVLKTKLCKCIYQPN